MQSNDIRLISDINNQFNENTLLTMENPETNEDIIAYIENLSEVFHKLDESNNKVKLCIDWGHILTSSKDISMIFNKIKKEDLLKYINEYHIHNIKDGKDHQPLYSGDVDCNDIYKLITKHNNDSKIILECEVNNMSKDGLDNIKLLTKNTNN